MSPRFRSEAVAPVQNKTELLFDSVVKNTLHQDDSIGNIGDRVAKTVMLDFIRLLKISTDTDGLSMAGGK